MSNTITASIEFYFKGIRHAGSLEVDLDQYMLATGAVPDFVALLADHMNIDQYSYEYEMMQVETVLYSHARNLAADYVHEGVFDAGAFEAAWSGDRIHQQLQEIAQRMLSIDDLHARPELKAALLEAYRFGESGKRNPSSTGK